MAKHYLACPSVFFWTEILVPFTLLRHLIFTGYGLWKEEKIYLLSEQKIRGKKEQIKVHDHCSASTNLF